MKSINAVKQQAVRLSSGTLVYDRTDMERLKERQTPSELASDFVWVNQADVQLLTGHKLTDDDLSTFFGIQRTSDEQMEVIVKARQAGVFIDLMAMKLAFGKAKVVWTTPTLQ